MTARPLFIFTFLLISPFLVVASDASAPENSTRVDLAEITEGATLDELLAEMGLKRRTRANLANALANSVDPRKLQPGQWMAVRFNALRTEVDSMVVHLGRGQRARVERLESGFSSEILQPNKSEVETTERFKIKGSLAKSAQKKGVPTAVVAQLEAALRTHINFNQEVHGGEPVRITFNQHLAGSGKPTRSDLVFARLSLARYTVTVARDKDGAWVVNREDPLSGHFRRPVDFARITSGFGPRLHPVSGQWKQHNGIDYGAPEGTPVYASAPGKINFVGFQRGYGRMVEILHRDGMSTRYAHLNDFSEGLEKGQVIGVGARIGSVGQTGTATGPNLHFEVRRNGVAVDPLETAIVFLPPIEMGRQFAQAD
ncbi:MAG: M23 family metallopeptidase [Pseudomonadota bacterium]